ncbi:MAG: hypothetical protein QNK20_04765 [Aureibaculum sp.]|nr:hypothetical protein [Aureibaculum sp.]
MTFLEKAQTSIFWRNVMKISSMFVIIIVIISLLFNSFSSIINFDVDAINSQNFTEGKWVNFIIPKLAIGLLYGMWVTNRNMK